MAERRVLITGAGSGLGRALAKRYAAEGFAVACADIKTERAAETVAMLAGAGHFALAVDIGVDVAVEAMRDEVRSRWDSIDVVVNNAGVASGGGLMDATMDEWHWMLNINLLGVVRGCRAFVPWLKAQRRGHIVNVASFAGLAGAPNIMTYGVAKGGVVTLSEQLRAELHADGVKVSVVCPSFFKTNLLENFGGNDTRMKAIAGKLMETATVSADDVANHVYDAVRRGRFLILPTPGEPLRWRLKRFAPETYFKQLLKMTRARGASTAKD
jgi:NAD(P)-dependent dehydrogenase (short-subunit alcohol dehydrogenase family)